MENILKFFWISAQISLSLHPQKAKALCPMVALMVESVDTRDLKSLGHYGRAGSTPAWGTTKRSIRDFLTLLFLIL